MVKAMCVMKTTEEASSMSRKEGGGATSPSGDTLGLDTNLSNLITPSHDNTTVVDQAITGSRIVKLIFESRDNIQKVQRIAGDQLYREPRR